MPTVQETSSKTARSRAIWMDLVRGLAIIAVIWGHAEAIGRTGAMFQSSDWMLVSNKILVLIRMPLLMFLSGMLVPRSIAKGWKKFLPGKFTKLAWPYAVWIAMFFVVLWIHEAALLSDIPMNILRPENPNQTPLWYLRNLFFYYLIAQAIAWLRLPLWTGAVLGLAYSAYQLIDGTAIGSTDLRFANLMTFFFLGTVAMQHLERIIRFVRKPPVALTLLILWLIPTFLYVSGSAPVRYRLEYIWGPLAFIALVLGFASFITSSRWTRPLEFVGRYSLYYYVMHYPLLLGYIWWVGWRFAPDSIIHFFIMIAVGLIIPTITVYVARWIPPVKWLFFELPWPRPSRPGR